MIEYSYQVLRYMPDQVSGEFMNVGLVVYHSPSQDIAIKVMKNNGRIQQFYPSGDAASLIDYLANIERVFIQRATANTSTASANPKSLDQITSQVLPEDNSSLYFIEVKKGLDVSIEEACDALYWRMVKEESLPVESI